MSTISKPNDFSANTTISSSEVNDNFDTIYNDYNGGITAANLASNAVTTAKITDANVTTAKIANNAITYALLDTNNQNGWLTDGRTWTYASGTGTNVGTFTVAGVDLTSVYNVGDRVKFTQTTVKYGIITKVAFSTDTTVTIYMGTDYTIANAAITSPFYSHVKSPVGFPLDPTKWTVTYNYTDDNSITSGTYAQVGSHQISVPIGAWLLRAQFQLLISASGNNGTVFYCSISANSTAEDDVDMTGVLWNVAVTSLAGAASSSHSVSKYIAVTSETTYYQIAKRTGASLTSNVRGSDATGKIEAVCAYL